MSPSSTGSPSDSTGPPDRQTLRLLERQLSDEPLITDTAFEPDAYEPRLLCARFGDECYSSSIDAARLDIRWFTSGDFSIHYIETTSADDHWECRWDRHPNDHNTRTHFHEPPDGDSVTDLSLSSRHPLDVYATVQAAIEQRLEILWETDGE